jgi:hypothetical protein
MCPVKNFLPVSLLLFSHFCMGQNYHAINGSPYAGSLATSYNPASIVDAPYAWDVTSIALQVKQGTNAFTIKNYSLLSSPKEAKVVLQNGTKERFAFSNQDVRLLNTRISLNANAAIAFGMNIRNYAYAVNASSNWQDTLYSLRDFMKINTGNIPLSGRFSGISWQEIYCSYAQTIVDDGNQVLNGGFTIKMNRGLAGGYADAEGVMYEPLTDGSGYLLTQGNLQYGYSDNFDRINSGSSNAVNRKAFLKKGFFSLGADVGAEYISFSGLDEDNEEAMYDTKIGISVMDIGTNKYRFGSRSRFAAGPQPGTTDTVLENKFVSSSTFDNFNDSLATISGNIATPDGNFFIYQPTRIVINVDRHIIQNFFINAELTLPVVSLASKNVLYIKDMNLLALTPRWETKSFGAYLPLLMNTRQQLWIGGAFKTGPLLLGIDNFSNLFNRSSARNGGLYLALTVRPQKKYDRTANAPRPKLTGRAKRSLECPRL